MSMGSLGSRLRKGRESKGLYQKDVAERLGITKSVISNYERDMRDPDTDNLKQMALMYNLSTDYLVGLTNEPLPLNIDMDTYNKLMSSFEALNDDKDLLEWWINAPANDLKRFKRLKEVSDLLDTD